MAFKALISLLALAAAVGAAPSKRAACSNGRSANDERVDLLSVLESAKSDPRLQCCVWFDVLDDIQENLLVSVAHRQPISLLTLPVLASTEASVAKMPTSH